MSVSTKQRTSTAECAKCHKPLKAGDRIIQVLIVEKVGKNPRADWETGAFLSPDFELAHVVCPDPGLIGKILSLE